MHLKMNNVDYLKKPSYFFIHIFAIKKSSRHEKRSHILARLFWLFQCSRNLETHSGVFRPRLVHI